MRPMHSLRVCALMLLLSVSTSVRAQDVFVHPDSAVQFPATFKDARRLSVQSYEDARLGVAVTYQLMGLGRADIYVYPAGVGKIPVGLGSDRMHKALADAHEDIAEMVRRGAFVAADPLFPATNTYELPDRIPRMYFSAYRMRRTLMANQSSVSWVFLTSMAQHLVKIRITHSELQMGSAQDRVAQVLEAFFSANRPLWQLPPREDRLHAETSSEVVSGTRAEVSQ